MKNHYSKRFLLVRTDRIGDLILTLPAVQSLRRSFPNCFIGFLTSSYAAPILDQHPDIDWVKTIDNPEIPLLASADMLREMEFDIAIHFYTEPLSAFLTYLSDTPVRIGPLSKLSSLFFTERLRQHRSHVEKHEAEYNLDLVKSCGADGIGSTPKIYLSENEIKRGNELLNALIGSSNKNPVIMHPGSKGSAQSWPVKMFLKLSLKISEETGEDVVITGGKEEEKNLNIFRELKHPKIHLIKPGSASIRELASIIQQGKCLISNSTGPLHMAVALGIPTLSFYPNFPIVTSQKRWGPYSLEKIHTVLSPLSEAPMSSIGVSEAFGKFKELDG